LIKAPRGLSACGETRPIFPVAVRPPWRKLHLSPPPNVAERDRFKERGTLMGKRDELIAKYADDLKNKCKMTPDMALLTKVTIGCGPSIYDNDASTVAASDKDELERIKANFLIKKLGLKDGANLMEGINAAIDTYGKSERNKFRAVFYYLLVKHFGKDSAYK
jgi:hypothetical protein